MTMADQKMKKYRKQVAGKLNLPPDVKKRVMADFESAIESRLEAGKTEAEIMEELGTASEAAAELNEQMREFAYTKSSWRWGCLVVMILCILSLLCQGLITALLNIGASNSSIGIIGGADGPTAIFVTQSPGSAIQGTLMTILILVMSIVGFWYLGHMRKK